MIFGINATSDMYFEIATRNFTSRWESEIWDKFEISLLYANQIAEIFHVVAKTPK